MAENVAKSEHRRDDFMQHRMPRAIQRLTPVVLLIVGVYLAVRAVCEASSIQQIRGKRVQTPATVTTLIAMGNMLVCPATANGWRIDPESLDEWLADRWPTAAHLSGTSSQRAHLWTWPDGHELWLPSDLDCCWIAADSKRIASTAVHLAAAGPSDLTLCDEGYNFNLALKGLAEADVLALL